MRFIFFLSIFLVILGNSQELKIKANTFSADQKKGLSIFSGDVHIVKGKDEINASKVTIFTNKKNKPIRFIAKGDVSFFVTTKEKARYTGKAQKVIYIPAKKEYQFYGNVHLQQKNEKKEILGDEVILKINSGKAYAKGVKKEPVIVIFDIPDETKNEKEKK